MASEGGEVDKNRSNERSVTLTNLVQSTTGRYRCEVSTEGPTFATVSQFGDLLVVGKCYDFHISGTLFAWAQWVPWSLLSLKIVQSQKKG